jgi:hypothetical protein
MLWTQAQADQRKRIDFAVVRDLLICLEALQSIDRIGSPLPVNLTFKIAAIGQSLLDFLVPFGSRLRLIGRRWSAMRLCMPATGVRGGGVSFC